MFRIVDFRSGQVINRAEVERARALSEGLELDNAPHVVVKGDTLCHAFGVVVVQAPDGVHVLGSRKLAITEAGVTVGEWAYGDIPTEGDTPAEDVKPQILLGSKTLPPIVDLGDCGRSLGDVVAAAHTASGMSVADWNAMTDEARDEWLNAWIDDARKQADPDRTDTNVQGLGGSTTTTEGANHASDTAGAPGANPGKPADDPAQAQQDGAQSTEKKE